MESLRDDPVILITMSWHSSARNFSVYETGGCMQGCTSAQRNYHNLPIPRPFVRGETACPAWPHHSDCSCLIIKRNELLSSCWDRAFLLMEAVALLQVLQQKSNWAKPFLIKQVLEQNPFVWNSLIKQLNNCAIVVERSNIWMQLLLQLSNCHVTW